MARWVWALGGVIALGLGLYVLRGVLSPIFFAFLIAYFLDPLVDRFEARGIPRALGITIVLGLTLGLGAVVLLLVLPGVIHEVRVFGRELPSRLDGLRQAVEPWLAEQGVEMPHSFDELRQLVGMGAAEAGATPSGPRATDLATQAGSVAAAVGKWIWGGTSSLLAVVSTLLVVPVFAFYLLLDFDRITSGVRDLVPWRYRAFVVEIAREVDQVLGQFVRGQILVMLALAVLYAVAYSIVGIRLAIPIGIVAGLLSFIPYVGGASALILALLMCALGWQGWGQVIGVAVAYGIIQVLESFLITPRVVGDKVGLSAVWVLFALMIGGEVFGFLGVLLALPAAAVGKIFVVRAVARYRQSRLFREGEPEPLREVSLVGGQADAVEEATPTKDALEPAPRVPDAADEASPREPTLATCEPPEEPCAPGEPVAIDGSEPPDREAPPDDTEERA